MMGAAIDKELPGNRPPRLLRRWTVFGLCAALFVLSQFYRAAVAVISPQLMSDLSLDARGLSLVSAAFFYAFAATQIPLAVYLDRMGARVTMTLLNAIAVCGAVVFAAASSLNMLVLARLLIGIGMACNLMGTFKLLSTWFDSRRFATLTTVVFSLGTAGNIGATTPLVLLVGGIGWRWAFVTIALINLVLTAVFCVSVRDGPSSGGISASPSAAKRLGDTVNGLRRLLQKKDYWVISLGTFCRYGIYAAIQSLYAGPYLIMARGMSAVTAGNIILVMNLGFILGGPFFGMVSDRLVGSRKGVVIPGLVGLALILWILAALPVETGPVIVALLFFLLGAANSTGGIMYSHIKERMPVEMAGAAMTGINFFTMIGPAVFLQALGGLMQAGHPSASLGMDAFRSAFSLCAVCLVSVAALYLSTADSRGEK